MAERKWQKLSATGWQCGEYRIGLFFLDGCSLYQVCFGDEVIGNKDELKDAMQVAKQHDLERVAGQA